MTASAEAAQSHPLAAPFYADGALQRAVRVVENAAMARDTFRLRLECPEIAQRIVPGQFLMLRLAGDDPLLARPLALFDTWQDQQGRPQGVDVVYLVVGRMTRRLAAVHPGAILDAWGPLGNGFCTSPVERLIMVAGGIGQTPFLALAREALGSRRYGDPQRAAGYAQQAALCYGVRTVDLLAGATDFQDAGLDLRLASDDGTVGKHGLVTDVLTELLDEPSTSAGSVRLACCGPEPMMKAVAEIAARRNLPCEASLETPMACGIGICFSCVTRVRQPDGQWDYKRTCVEGPVFDAQKIAW